MNENTTTGQAGIIGGDNEYETDCADCDNDGLPDRIALRIGLATDADGNGIPDDCAEPPCPEDLTNDGAVNGADLTTLLAFWGACGTPCLGDIDQSGTVDGQDLTRLLAAWGSCL